ncbi:hypothetical protein JIK52_20020 [Klebsiella variicola]|nr:hypothetical protein [Klebsiella variicola]QQM84620.1 hypothetical protein JIK52_20020 [Klebsiella variicola]
MLYFLGLRSQPSALSVLKSGCGESAISQFQGNYSRKFASGPAAVAAGEEMIHREISLLFFYLFPARCEPQPDIFICTRK